ncbi:PAS domain S-box protein [Laspinema olomoucense]|uniref:PAS domain S-box protein n=1 Tax=Laspinema olomoucense TaxID=3231600 RepID=UPI0021BB658F|nr:PAS domain S-box protein [Laspinema sp. D3c]MCT7994942.1 PAS domain S-box protein [Laspinema sp. D3c]
MDTIRGQYEPVLVALSFIIGAVASYTALDLAGRVNPKSSGRSRLIWSVGGAVAMGTGIWSMHFIAMLAFQLPVPTAYNIPLTLLSWVDAIVASALAMLLYNRQQLKVRLLVGGGVVMGLAIASMHYLGMAAVQVPATLHYNPWGVTLSVAVAIFASTAALRLAFQVRDSLSPHREWLKVGSAGIMGVAIAGMHYTGMWATCFAAISHPEAMRIEGADQSWLAMQIGLGTLILLVGTLITSLVDRRYQSQMLREQALQESETRFRTLVENMPVGVLLLDAKGTILLSNPLVRELLDLSETELQGKSAFELNWQILSLDGTILIQEQHPLNQAIALGQPVHNQVTGICRWGKKDTVWLLLNMDPHIGSSGEVERVVCTFSNISDRKQSEDEIRLLLDTNQAIRHAPDLESALASVLRSICITINWDVAEAWLPDANHHSLTYRPGWYYPEPDVEEFRLLREPRIYRFGEGLPGRVWESRQPEWIENLTEETEPLADALTALKQGLKACFAVPIIRGNGILAVLTFFKRRESPRDERAIALVGAVATQLGSSIGQKVAEAALSESERRLQLALEGSELGIWDWQIPTGKTYFDPQWKGMLGYEVEEIGNHYQMWEELLHPEDRKPTLEALQDHLKGILPVYERELRMRSKSGEWKWILSRGKVVERDPSGIPLRMSGTHKDITPRKSAEAALDESQRRYQTLAEASPVCIFHTDAQGNCLYVNQRWSELTGLSLEGAIGKSWIANLHPDDLKRVQSEWFLAAETRVPFKSEYRFVRPNGIVVWAIGQAIAEIGDDGKVQGYLGTITDISERKRAEIALQQQLKRERLVSSIQERIRSSLDLEEVLETAVNEVRKFLATDRILIYRFNPNWGGVIAVESVGSDWMSVKGIEIEDRCFIETHIPLYAQGRIRTIDNIHTAGLSECHVELLSQFAVQANLVVPLRQGEQLWGLLIAHHCSGERQWHESEIESLRQLSVQLSIAIQQCTLFEQAKTELLERKRAEDALRESEERFKLAVSGTNDGIWDWDLKNDQIYYSPVWMQILGYEEGELPYRVSTWFNKVHPDDLSVAMQTLQDHVQGQNPLYYYHTHRMERKDKSWIWVEVKGKCIRNEEGEAYRLTGTLTDITERKKAEAALQESVERERALSQVIQRMRETLDLETIFSATTRELRQVLKCDRVLVHHFHDDWRGEVVAESTGPEWISLMDNLQDLPETAVKLTGSDSDLLGDNEVVLEDCYMQSARTEEWNLGLTYLAVEDVYNAGFDESYLNILEQFQAKAYIIVPIFSGNKLWGLLASYQNSGPRHWKEAEIKVVVQIGNQLGVALQQAELLEKTQRQSQALQKAALAADAANRAKSEFLANMSHELRTPLNAILGFTQVLARDSSLKPENHEHLKIINRAGGHLLALINDVLEMSKIEAGRMSFNPVNFDLINLLKSLNEMFQLKAESKQLQIIFEGCNALPQFVKTDESKLRQVLINIVGNAIKFTETGRVILRIEVKDASTVVNPGEADFSNSSNQGKFLYLEIEDTGPGIAPEEMGKLFEPFGQTETGRKSQQGTGLGLPISRKFVQLMGGDIQVTSTVGQGTVFAFAVAIAPSSEAEIQTRQNKRRPVAIAPQSKANESRILVVDDAFESRLLLKTILKSLGFQVQEAENGQAAIAVYESWKPHLILMDMQMPVMDGYEATRHIKNTVQGQKTTIVALTASAFEEERKMILDAGCDDFIRKPFQEELLLETIGQYLNIDYIFEDLSPDDLNRSQPDSSKPLYSLSPEALKVMPESWIYQLSDAAMQCSDDLILRLLEEIPPDLSHLSQALAELAHNYQFDLIEQLTQQEGQ